MPQVEDDPELLELMLQDLEKAPEEFHPTNYWKCYQAETIAYLREKGLKDFRSTTQGHLGSFGANDLHPLRKVLENVSLPELSPEALEKIIFTLKFTVDNPAVKILPHCISFQDLDETAYRVAELYGRACGAKPLHKLEASLHGTPEYVFRIEGRSYTYAFLYYYMRYCYCCRFIAFDTLENLVELSPGCGKQIEIIKKLHPHITVYALDLPPQLYVCSQYLKSLFPAAVTDYSGARALSPVTAQKRGEILILGNWRIDALKPKGTTLFWSAASFGEMEPAVSARYLASARSFADYIYLFQCEQGKRMGKSGEKQRVLEATTWEHYSACLTGGYRLIDRSPAYEPLKRMKEHSAYFDALWARQ